MRFDHANLHHWKICVQLIFVVKLEIYFFGIAYCQLVKFEFSIVYNQVCSRQLVACKFQFFPNVSLIHIFHEMPKSNLKIGERHIPSSITFGHLVDRLNRRICVGCIIHIISSMVCVIIYITFKRISLHFVLSVKCCFNCYYQPTSVSNCPNPVPLLDQWEISENSVRDPNEWPAREQ